MSNSSTKLSRETEAIEIPSGVQRSLPAGAEVRVMQYLGSSYTVTTNYGMFRIDVKDADALGLQPSETPASTAGQEQTFSEQLVWDQLKTVFDPEIPVNIADLGLIYSCVASPLDAGASAGGALPPDGCVETLQVRLSGSTAPGGRVTSTSTV